MRMAVIVPDLTRDPTGQVFVDALIWGGAWTGTLGGGATLTWAAVESVTFPKDDPETDRPVLDPETGEPVMETAHGMAWDQTGLEMLRLALRLWDEVSGLAFAEAAPDAGGLDLVYLVVSAEEMARIDEPGTLGFHATPDGDVPAPLPGVFQGSPELWGAEQLRQGGYSFITVVHEIGHGLGLAHPHDEGGGSPRFPGVEASGDLGRHQMNQGVWTVMSYNDGWISAFPDHGAGQGFGYEATPMALDIAAIQALYGADTTTRTGDDAYALPGANGPGTFWACIWDAGGRDEISAAGLAGDATIDLRPAPLAGRHAGGFVSSAEGVIGGFTIAAGVVIEDAAGGAGQDRLTGNAAANRLSGGGGGDALRGLAGDDLLEGGAGRDRMAGGEGADRFLLTEAAPARDAVDRLLDFAPGQDLILLDAAAFAALGGAGPLAAAAFAPGRRAEGGEGARILHDAEAGLLRFDADGAGGAAAAVIARLTPGLALTAADFQLA
jgi:serralysin